MLVELAKGADALSLIELHEAGLEHVFTA